MTTGGQQVRKINEAAACAPCVRGGDCGDTVGDPALTDVTWRWRPHMKPNIRVF